MNLVLFIAVGGAIGAVGRYAVMTAISHLFGEGYPYGTILVNLIGSFVLGALVEGLKKFFGHKQRIAGVLSCRDFG